MSRIVLVGAKGSGKSALLKALEQVNLSKLDKGQWPPTLIPNQLDEGKLGKWNIDRLADYRTELELALDRIEEQEVDFISESSLIDSVGYAATRMTYLLNDEIGNDDDLARWEITLHAASRMLRDSTLPDAVLFVPGYEAEDFYERLEEALDAVVWEFLPDTVQKFKLQETDTLQRAEESAKILEELNEQSDTTTESDRED
jgi:energy-coupling factor transporter ATP-binding protein EcfA2